MELLISQLFIFPMNEKILGGKKHMDDNKEQLTFVSILYK